MNDKLQSQLTYFLWPSNTIGWVIVAKRCLSVIGVGTVLDGHPYIGTAIIVLREALSTITDITSPKNPINSISQASPPATNPITDEQTS